MPVVQADEIRRCHPASRAVLDPLDQFSNVLPPRRCQGAIIDREAFQWVTPERQTAEIQVFDPDATGGRMSASTATGPTAHIRASRTARKQVQRPTGGPAAKGTADAWASPVRINFPSQDPTHMAGAVCFRHQANDHLTV